MPAPERIKQLVEIFEQNINEYRFRKNETELRRQFLDPFFEALGWDVDNKKGSDERNKEVAHEYSVEIDGQQKKADYAFRTVRDDFDFLVEAKKPSVKIESNFESAYQLRRYGWSARLPINILTDFEHFAIYDCRTRPNYSKDKVNTGLIDILHYKEFVEKWDEIAALFSPEAVRNGALDQFKDTLKTKKGTQEVDDAFLEEIEAWRETLARNIATRNKHLDLNEDQVNFAVQMTIDRIIFLRIAEERGMERDRRLLELCDETDIYQNLLKLFKQADTRYNSGLFHFKRDKERENPDAFTPTLDIDDKVLRDIIKDLYYPSPYAFNYIPTEILGSVYERFLGKVIRLTAGGNAKVEDKPEVRKAGGVYYTPAYIVDYIVKNTVGRIVNPPATPDDVSKIKIVDPACGSGSFLLGAYQYLLDWHLDWYVKNDLDKELKKKTILTADNKTYRLSIDEKKRILLNNIHGVDLDPQAVEVTKLSLLLKVVEDPGQLKMFEEGRILPDLNRNIKNGNALIGTNYFSEQMFGDMEEMKRVKPFDWKSEFPEVFRRGGFDVVIGNPPYIRVRIYKELYPNEAKYFETNYECATHVWDVYLLFFEKAIAILRKAGRLSFIVPIQTLHQPNCESVRKLLLNQTSIISIADLSQLKVFQDVIVKNCILVSEKTVEIDNKVSIFYPATPKELLDTPLRYWPQSYISRNPSLSMKIDLMSPKKLLCEKLEEKSWRLEELCYVTFGLRSSAKGVGQGGKERLITTEKNNPIAKPYLEGRDIKRFVTYPTGRFIKYIPAEMYSARVPELFENKKIVSQSMLSKKRLIATLDNDGFYVEQSLVCIIPHGIITEVITQDSVPLEFILGIVNSKLESFYFATSIIDHSLGGGLIHATPGSQSKLIIPKASKLQVGAMVTLVKQMLFLHKSLTAAKDPQESELLQRQIKSTDRQIDELVYQLYGLTDDEIRIIEG